MNILVLHGPNLNLLGTREPEYYGEISLQAINDNLTQLAHKLGFTLSCVQSNHEGVLIDQIQTFSGTGIVINAGAYTHTSIGIRDALIAKKCPFVEVHMSNVFARESFRHHSFLSDIALGVITGFGMRSYTMGLEALCAHLRNI